VRMASTQPESPQSVPLCTVCGGNQSKLYLHAPESIYRCAACSHVFSDSRSPAGAEQYDAAYYMQTHRNWFAHPNIGLFSWIVRHLPANANSVLDVGCGKGAFLQFLRQRMDAVCRLVGIDYSPNDPAPGIEYRQGDITTLPVEYRFDVVVSLAVNEHVADPVAFAGALADRCNPGGTVIVMTLDNDSLLYGGGRLMAKAGIRGPCERLYSTHHLQHFTSRSLRIVLEGSGLEILKLHRHNAPIAALDIPVANPILRAIYTAGVIGLLWAGSLAQRTYLQTMIARRTR